MTEIHLTYLIMTQSRDRGQKRRDVSNGYETLWLLDGVVVNLMGGAGAQIRYISHTQSDSS